MKQFAQDLKMAETLRLHFPAADEDKRAAALSRLFSIDNLANSFQRLERSVRPAKKDVESLLKIQKLLLSASKELKEVGWYGAVPLHNTLNADAQALTSSKTNAPRIVSKQIEAIAEQVAIAAREAPIHGETIYDDVLIGAANPSRNSKPSEFRATRVAVECAKVFHALGGQKPSVNTRAGVRDEGTAYGPFLDFVTDVFETLGISASPEARARAACAEWRKGRKSED